MLSSESAKNKKRKLESFHFSGTGEHKQRTEFKSDESYYNYLRDPKQVHQADLSFRDRKWMLDYAKKKGIDRTGLCYCQRPFIVKKAKSGKFIDMEYQVCKYDLCRFFRWCDSEEYKKRKRDDEENN